MTVWCQRASTAPEPAGKFLVSAGRLVASTTFRTDRREVPARMAERHETMMTPAIEGTSVAFCL